MRPLILAALLMLTACGADGPPLTPTSDGAAPRSSITFSGDAAIGVTTKIN